MPKNRENMGGPTRTPKDNDHQKGEERSRGHGEGGLTVPSDVPFSHKAETSGDLFEAQHTVDKKDVKRETGRRGEKEES